MKLGDFINRYFFSAWSAAVHTVWFIVWFAFKLDVGLLTNIVSLEAIYLSIFIGLAQKEGHKAIRKHLDKGATIKP